MVIIKLAISLSLLFIICYSEIETFRAKKHQIIWNKAITGGYLKDESTKLALLTGLRELDVDYFAAKHSDVKHSDSTSMGAVEAKLDRLLNSLNLQILSLAYKRSIDSKHSNSMGNNFELGIKDPDLIRMFERVTAIEETLSDTNSYDAKEKAHYLLAAIASQQSRIDKANDDLREAELNANYNLNRDYLNKLHKDNKEQHLSWENEIKILKSRIDDFEAAFFNNNTSEKSFLSGHFKHNRVETLWLKALDLKWDKEMLHSFSEDLELLDSQLEKVEHFRALSADNSAKPTDDDNINLHKLSVDASNKFKELEQRTLKLERYLTSKISHTEL